MVIVYHIFGDVSKIHACMFFVFEIEKGQNPHTEMYSALRAEIPVEDDAATQLNTKEIERWDGYDRVIFCGQV